MSVNLQANKIDNIMFFTKKSDAFKVDGIFELDSKVLAFEKFW